MGEKVYVSDQGNNGQRVLKAISLVRPRNLVTAGPRAFLLNRFEQLVKQQTGGKPLQSLPLS
jgi:hypothetical protein